MIEENNDIINNEEEEDVLLTQDMDQEEEEDYIDDSPATTEDKSVSYSENPSSVKAVRDFYSSFSEYSPTDVEVDSIISHYDGDDESMIRDMYKNFRPDYDLTEEDIESVTGHYGLKKKILRSWMALYQIWRMEAWIRQILLQSGSLIR